MAGKYGTETVKIPCVKTPYFLILPRFTLFSEILYKIYDFSEESLDILAPRKNHKIQYAPPFNFYIVLSSYIRKKTTTI